MYRFLRYGVLNRGYAINFDCCLAMMQQEQQQSASNNTYLTIALHGYVWVEHYLVPTFVPNYSLPDDVCQNMFEMFNCNYVM